MKTPSIKSRTTAILASAALLTSALTVETCFGQGPIVANGDFEQSSGFSVPGWVYSGSIFTLMNAASWDPDGVILLFNAGQNPPNGVLSQSVATEPGQSYTLSFDFGAYSQTHVGTQQSLLVEVTGASLLGSLAVSSAASNPAVLNRHEIPFVADGPLTQLTFRDTSTATIDVDGGIDNVMVTGPFAPHPPLLQLSVEYSMPSVVSGPVSFGLSDLPNSFVATFTLVGYSQVENVSAGLESVGLITIRFGDGLWTAPFTSFALETDATGEVTSLSYSMGPITSPTVASGIVSGSSSSATLSGTNLGTSQAFEYLYSASSQNVTLLPALPTPGAPTLIIVPAGTGVAQISWSPDTPGFMLQETPGLSPTNWMNSVSGTNNPVSVPVPGPTKFYRLFKP